MKSFKAFAVASVATLAILVGHELRAQDSLVVSPSPGTVGGPLAGTVMTKEYIKTFGRNVYLWGWPLIDARHRRASFARAPEPGYQGGVLPAAPTGYVSMLRDYITPAQRFVAHPNQDVVYGFGFAAVDKDPVIIQVPDFGDRFWVYALYDARSDEFSKLGKQYGSKPGLYMVVGPNWKGDIPAGIIEVFHSPTDLVGMAPRVFMDDTAEDRKAIQPVINQVLLYPLNKFTGRMETKDWAKAPSFGPSSQGGKETRWVDPDTFFDELPDVLNEVPPLPGEEALYANIRALLEEAAKHPEIKATLKEVAADTEKSLITPLFAFTNNGVPIGNGWTTPANGARFGYDYVTRTATAKSNMYVNQPEETRYFFLDIDADGKRMNGKNRYTITFPPGQSPPANGFWSLTMYDKNHFFSPNAIKRYSLGTKNKTLKMDSDGSLTIYLQHDSPGENKESNWLPAPADDFSTTIRTYWPKPEVLEGQWVPPAAVKSVKAD
ncbi:DUF1254 domain-containing protein [Rhizobium sp. 18055]|uniref:DUF1254 domain-containing protein n=1 Tax=Rhizobium sp. 18055 TaxID=2681403 RepID=UPI00135AAF58|nr:DUF1254 domain-containing protein [Rhizobium sp. 18055]